MTDTAVYDETKVYRYSLTRRLWSSGQGRIAFILLNPSTATEVKNDPTVARCIKFGMREKYAELEILNIFAFRSKNPETLYRNTNPVGLSNDQFIIEGVRKADVIVCGWGNHGEYQLRGNVVKALLDLVAPNKIYYFGSTKYGYPLHPLYLHNKAEIRRWVC